MKHPQYTLYAVRVFVRDFEAAERFYRDVLGLKPGFVSHEAGWAEFDTGGGRIALERIVDAEGEALAGRFVGVSLQVDDIDAVYRLLCERGVTFAMAPERQDWGGTLAHLRDPEGNVLSLLG